MYNIHHFKIRFISRACVTWSCHRFCLSPKVNPAGCCLTLGSRACPSQMLYTVFSFSVCFRKHRANRRTRHRRIYKAPSLTPPKRRDPRTDGLERCHATAHINYCSPEILRLCAAGRRTCERWWIPSDADKQNPALVQFVQPGEASAWPDTFDHRSSHYYCRIFDTTAAWHLGRYPQRASLEVNRWRPPPATIWRHLLKVTLFKYRCSH